MRPIHVISILLIQRYWLCRFIHVFSVSWWHIQNTVKREISSALSRAYHVIEHQLFSFIFARVCFEAHIGFEHFSFFSPNGLRVALVTIRRKRRLWGVTPILWQRFAIWVSMSRLHQCFVPVLFDLFFSLALKSFWRYHCNQPRK